MEQANVILDFVLIFVAIWMIFAARSSGLGGVIGTTLTFITIGALVLGLAHLIETITVEQLGWDIVLVELVHRILILAGFVFLAIGFQGLGKMRQTT